MTFSQPEIETVTDKNIPTKQVKKRMRRMIRMHRLLHPSTRTCQGALAVVDLISCGFPMALTLPQYHRILLETLPTTPDRMNPITHPKSPGPRLSPIQASFSEIKRDLAPHNRPEARDHLTIVLSDGIIRTNVLNQGQEKDCGYV